MCRYGMTIAINSDNLVSLTGHQDTVSSDYINTATVTASCLSGTTTLFTSTLSYVSSSNGNYRGTFSAAQTTALVAGTAYVIRVVATSSYGTLTVQSEDVAGYSSGS